MGTSLPPAAPIDLVGSYARRRGDRVEVVLNDPTFLAEDSPVVAILRKDGQRVRATATLLDDAPGRRLVISCHRRKLSRGVWSIALRRDGERQRVDARLLVQGQRPVVLLWGATGPVSRPAVPYAERYPAGLTRRVARRLGRAAGRVRR